MRTAIVKPPSGVASPSAGAADPYASCSDADLVMLVRDGDGRALEAIHTRYARPAYSLARRILTDPQLAQDAVQEVFLTLWRDASRYDPTRGGFSTWLLAMVHHKSVDAVRREENLRKRRGSLEVLAGTEATEHVDDEVWSTLRSERVRSALGQLPIAQREALTLAYYGGYTQREIAGLTQTPLGTVKTRMLAGMRKMRDNVQGLSDGTWDMGAEGGRS